MPSRLECEPLPYQQIAGYVEAAASREGVTAELVKAVIEKESSFRPCAVSGKGAVGLMQLMPSTILQLGVASPFDPEENISSGAKFLGQLLDRYGGDLSLALAAYNAGPGRVEPSTGIPPIPETLKYVSDLLGKLTPQSVESQ